MSVHGSGTTDVAVTEVGSVSLEETRIRSKRSVIKRRITTTLRKLEGLVSKSGSKTIIKGYVNNLSEYLKEAEALNTQLLALVRESEQEAVLNWYEEQLERVGDAKLEAESHLEGRLHEVSSVAGTFPGIQESPKLPNLISSKSVMTCSSKLSGKAAELHAKAFAAELKAKQLMEEEEKRKQELEKQLELEKNVAIAKEIAERAKLEPEERRKVQQATDESRCLRAEAEMLENEKDDPESLSNRLRDFENEPSDKEQPSKKENQQSSLRNITEDSTPVTVPEKSPLNGKLTNQVGQKYHSDNGVSSILIQPNPNNLPRLKLSSFDGDPLKWPDWISMFKSMVDDTKISLNSKLQHLQNSVTGKAKTSIEGYGYGGDSYNKALSELESRFGKPSLVIKATLGGPNGCLNTYAMLDSGSTCSLVLSSVADKLGLEGSQEQIILNGIQGTSKLNSKRVNTQVSAVNMVTPRFEVNGALVVEHLNIAQQKVNLVDVKSKWPHLKEIDIPEASSCDVSLLIGSDCLDIILPIETRCGPRGTPVGIRTKLGWTITGPLPGYIRNSEGIFHVYVRSPDEELHSQVKSWWRTEEFGCKYDVEVQRSVEDSNATRILEDTTKKVDGRYEVPLLWKKGSSPTQNNRTVAEHRLALLEKRLQRGPKLAEAYKETIHSDMEKGYIKRIVLNESASEEKQWYLPHHPVLNPNKPGKVRRVCDAACRYQGSSLNDHLITGPDLLNSLTGIFIRFREEKIALSADIEAMFSQVAVPKEDQPVLRFLWRDSPDSEMETYQYQRHIFGAKCAPTCANYALRQNARDNEHEFPNAAAAIERNFYMGDLFKSVDSVTSAIKLCKELIELCQKGKFRLTKWISNDRHVIEKVPETERALLVKSMDERTDMPVERTLGVGWDTQRDNFVFIVRQRPSAQTRRQLLSIIASLFDPLGFLAPFLVRAKILLQRIWQLGLTWDEPLPQDLLVEWKLWEAEMLMLKEFSVPRFYRQVDEYPEDIDVHIFGDASELAFCSVGYLRFKYEDGSVKCVFVVAKTRVAPTKKLSIPRLKLQAAVLCVRLASVIIKEHDYKFSSIHFWSDSTTVLHWIRGVSTRHPSFIANRLSEILDATEVNQWHYCPTKLNPADDGTRGLPVLSITTSSRWLMGPDFLLLDESEWLEDITNKVVNDIVPGVGTESDVIFTGKTTAQSEPNELVNLTRYSSYSRALTVMAYVQRFLHNCKVPVSERKFGSPSVEELERAKKILIRQEQIKAFPSEFKDLKRGRPVHKQSKLVSLTPFLDEDDIIRVGGRIRKAPIPFVTRHPIVLDSSSGLTKLIIIDTHNKLGHAGVDNVRNELRQQFWILRCKATVKKNLHCCWLCKLRRTVPRPPRMAELPRDRLLVSPPPFTKVGVDYFGPLQVKYGRKQLKRYICLFTCLVTRAVHLEVAFSLETDSFIMCLRRFVARRGNPQVIYSDNGTNFVGADCELKECIENWNQDKIANELSPKGIKWVFNPPASPHMGGAWERLVRSCKTTFKAVLKKQVLTDEVLAETMAEVESLVNSRPLTEVSSDVDAMEAITPNHFILGRPSINLSPGVFIDKEISSRKRWRQSQVVTNHLWGRWLREYLLALVQRAKWTQDVPNLKVGDLVIVVDYSTPRCTWPLGRIVKVYRGSDKIVRSVDVKTKFGVFRRPTTKIATLEE